MNADNVLMLVEMLAMLDMVKAYVLKWKMKFIKSKVMLVGKE